MFHNSEKKLAKYKYIDEHIITLVVTFANSKSITVACDKKLV